MQIKLAEDGPPMWFLGEPRNLIVSLTGENPGPIELDFYKLGTMDQMRVLTAMKNGEVEGDPSFEDLYAEWSKKSKHTPPQQNPPANAVAEAIINSRLKTEVTRTEREAKFQERCDWAVTQNIKSLKSLIQNSDDIRFLRTILQAERTGKGRKTVIRWITERLNRFEKVVANEAIKFTPNARDPYQPKETIPYAVVESEQETIVLSPEELIDVLAK